jgi:hypothetical protein
VRDRRDVESVAYELHAIEPALLFAAGVPGETYAVAVREGPTLSADIDRDRGMARRFDADDADGL